MRSYWAVLRRLDWLFIVVMANSVVLIALLAGLPYWLDEVASIFFVHRSFSEMILYLVTDIHPPLYFFLLHWWTAWFGVHWVITAIPSIIFHIIAAWLLYRFTATLFDRSTARVALLLFASSFYFLYYATETRMYAMTLAISLAANLLLYHYLRHPRRRDLWWGYVGLSILGVYTHYFFWLIIVAQNVAVVALRCLRRTAISARAWISAQLTIALMFLPWLPVMVDRILGKSSQLDWMGDIPLSRAFLTTVVAGLTPVNPLYNIIFVSSAWAWVSLIIIFGFLFFRRLRFARNEIRFEIRAPTTPAIYLAVIAVVPLAIGVIAKAWIPRYFFTTIAIIIICCARWLVVATHVRWRRAFIVTALAVIMASDWWLYFHEFRYLNTFRWPEIAAFFESRGPIETNAIIFGAPEERLEFLHYYRGSLPVMSFLPRAYAHGFPELDRVRIAGLPVVTPENVREVAAQIWSFPRVCLVEGPSVTLTDRNHLLREQMEKQCDLHSQVIFRGAPAWVEISVRCYHRCRLTPAITDAASP